MLRVISAPETSRILATLILSSPVLDAHKKLIADTVDAYPAAALFLRSFTVTKLNLKVPSPFDTKLKSTLEISVAEVPSSRYIKPAA